MIVPLSGTNHVIDLVIVKFSMEFYTAGLKHRSTQQEFRAIVTHEFVIACPLPILLKGVGNVRSDVQLNIPVGYGDELFRFGMDNNLWSSFFPIQRTLPWKLRTFIAISFCFFTRGRKEVIAI